MNLFFLTLSAFFFFGHNVTANTIHQLNITQHKDRLQIIAVISSDQSKVFTLQKSAHVTSVTGFSKTTSAAGDLLFTSLSTSPASITYELPVDLSRVNYFVEDENWYPRETTNELQEFYLTVKNDPGFAIIHSAIGQSPEGVSLVFGVFTKYAGKKINIFLQKPDATLAKTLTDTLEKYLKLYEEKIGPYPYDDFSVVESSDEIGYAFPRMTWIGTKLLRFPFILTTSLPHELLHSWWGNSVFVDHASGNWCEGLTTYLADYGLLDANAKRNYRRNILMEYADYVKTGNEISLAKFVSRGEDKSLQSIGYGKSAMMFSMLEDLVGPDSFSKALKSFYVNFKNKKATYHNFFSEVARHTDVDASVLNNFYNQWVNIPGSVAWTDLETRVVPTSAKRPSSVQITMSPTDSQRLLGLPVEFNFQFKDGSSQDKKTIAAFSALFEFAQPPLSYSIDPNFRIFRALDDAEHPLSFSRFFAAHSADILATPESIVAATQTFSSIELQTLSALSQIDFEQSGTVLIEDYQGGNTLIDQALQKASIKILSDAVEIQDENLSLLNNAYFVSLSIQSKKVILFKLNSSLALNRWFERWSHYGNQSYVVLTPTGALKQGLRTGNYERPL